MSAEIFQHPSPPVQLDPLATAKLVGVPQAFIDEHGAEQLLPIILDEAIIALSDETSRRHNVLDPSDPAFREFFQVEGDDQAPSVVGRNIQQLIAENHPEAPRIQLAAAQHYVASLRRGERLGSASSYLLTPNKISVPTGDIRLRHSLGLMIEYGPGLRGLGVLRRSIEDDFPYVAISNGPFVSEVLATTLIKTGGENRIASGDFVALDNGMGAGSTALLETYAETAALVVASMVQTASSDQLAAGIANAHKLLRRGGTLFIQGPEEVDDFGTPCTPVDSMFAMALDSGFRTFNAIYLPATPTRSNLGSFMVKGAGFRK